MLSVLPVLARARGAALAEPVLDDFLYLHHELLGKHFNLLDGGGLLYYWRPLARQVYYRLMGPLLLAHPTWVAALHAVLLGLAALLIYRTLRRRWPAPWAAAAASFPLLCEPTTMLIGWSSNFQDLGAILFAVLALQEASKRRLHTALLALLASLLCKEFAAITALFLPWMPGQEPHTAPRRARWTAATALVVGAWGATYW